ncbi:MAG: EAL domain-containing protein [Gammaproteobacteria bacterium]|nr:EAL domain-containing protein [Gammaproteobacteria bacterium]
MEYQPIIDIKTGQVISAEALLRCNSSDGGKVYPDEIISIAEQTGLINPITYWVFESAARYIKRLKQSGIKIKIAINLSIYNLQENHFIENVMRILNRNSVSPSNFIIEITESVMMTNPKKSIDILTQLNELGIEIAVDDFGTGYSSLAYLKQLPLSKLKIDKSFIMDMIEDDNDAIIVRSTIDLAHNLEMNVIAEGIEEKEILQLLAKLGCESGQGYYISRPKTEDDLKQWILETDMKKLINGISK